MREDDKTEEKTSSEEDNETDAKKTPAEEDKETDAMLKGLSDKPCNKKEAKRATEKDMGEGQYDETLKYTSNHKDTGKLAGYSTDDAKINTMMDDYTGADNDDFMHEILEDFATRGKKTPGNPEGVELTKWNGERATRKFVETALRIEGSVLDGWMTKYFEKAWEI